MWFAQTICFALKLVIKYCNLDDFKKRTHARTHARAHARKHVQSQTFIIAIVTA